MESQNSPKESGITTRDAAFQLTLAGDLLTARLTLTPQEGAGKAISQADIEMALINQGISYGVLHSHIADALVAGHCDELTVAQGELPTEGVPARFHNLLDEQQHKLPDLDESAIIKFSDLSHLLLTRPGDKLMRVIPAVQGRNGTNVKGEVIPAQPLAELSFPNNLQGAIPDPKDPNLLLATIAGQPVIMANGISVNPVIEVHDVDLSTGNIVFEGTINVNGDIKAGMKIDVSGDVFVADTVEAAEIIAGGNVIVKGGVIGASETRAGGHALPEHTAKIICKGSVQALFMESAHVEAGDSITVGRSVRQCELMAGNEIVVGYSDPRHSQLAGGVTKAGKLLKATALGSKSGIKTVVEVGFDPYLDKEILKNDHAMHKKHSDLEETLKAIVFLQNHVNHAKASTVDGLKKLRSLREQLFSEINALTTEREALNARLELAEQARVETLYALYYGVEVLLCKQVWKATEDLGKTSIGLEEGTIAVK